MPTYEFRCPNGHDFERFYKTMSAAAMELECPECGAMGTRRMSGGAGLMFKGSGFYLTDYGKNAHRAAPPAKKEGGDKTEGSSKAETPKAAEGAKKAESREPKAESKPAKPPKSE